MADETIIAGNPAVLRMKFERDGCVVTATALDIGEMPNAAYYHGEYTILKCGSTMGNVVLTGRLLSINHYGVPDPYTDARTKTYGDPELAHEAMASFADAVDKMGRFHAPSVSVPIEDTPFFPVLPQVETDGDFALRMLRGCYTRTVIYPMSAAWMQRGKVQTSVADAIRLATLIGGAA